ncbi:MAG TPA: shikimate dehydrogenase, partial [Acidimicrobiia bacterium]|nr:shikimate dehydrogenase [Acidimicrobiia bacterium]
FDLVYLPAVTPLLTAASERGLAAVNGIGMLVAQAAIAFERWTGVAGAEDVMRLAVEQLGQDRTTEA